MLYMILLNGIVHEGGGFTLALTRQTGRQRTSGSREGEGEIT